LRKIYETQYDLDNEKSISEVIQSVCNLSLRKLSMKYFIDFIAFRNKKAVAVVEVKKRNNNHDTYPTLILSLAKYNRGVEFFKVNGLKFIFAVQFNDGCFFYKYKDGDRFAIELGGRIDRKDAEDIEPVIHIPINRMKKL
tara:strand:+ start:69 stop:488 length:420 start_codon:yes stop_codon:yes gene_type:complete